ncbi:unnamed protein product [Musa acuminata var. zebrina]
MNANEPSKTLMKKGGHRKYFTHLHMYHLLHAFLILVDSETLFFFYLVTLNQPKNYSFLLHVLQTANADDYDSF